MSLYDILRTVWDRERTDDQLVSLDDDFYEKSRAYVNHLEMQSKNEPDELLAELFEKRWERTNFLVNDIIDMRMKKHIRDTLDGISKPDELPIEEKDFREGIEQLFSQFRDKAVGIETEDTEQTSELMDDGQYRLVYFTKKDQVTSVGADLKNYGPFDKGDFALLPAQNARNYLKRSQVEQIGIDVDET